MTQLQAHYGHHVYYGECVGNMGLESYYIVDGERTDKWYLRTYDEDTNQVVWTHNIKLAKEFHTKDDAIEFGSTTKRVFFIEEVEDWIL